MIEHMDDILTSGIDSLKIEGRMKQPGYTAAVTGMYRKYLDILLSSDMTYQVNDRDRQLSLDIFSRGGPVRVIINSIMVQSMMAFTNEKKDKRNSGKSSSKKKNPFPVRWFFIRNVRLFWNFHAMIYM